MPGSRPERWRPGRIAAFLALGGLLYLGLLLWSEHLVRRTGDRNPFFRIEQAARTQDWLILGASHAMPLDFAEMESLIEAGAGKRLLNLSATGTGPFVWRLVAQRFFRDHEAAAVLIIIDAFAFRDRRWNEDRIGDSDLMPRIPWDRATLSVLASSLGEGLPPATFANFLTGFSKINNPDRMRPDIWEAEQEFERSPRPSDAADRARIAYLYPGPADPAAEEAAFGHLDALVQLARANGAEVILIRPPLPDRFRKLMPGEEAFSGRLQRLAVEDGLALQDMSALLPEPGFYFDPDHLNRSGVEAWLDRGLAQILTGP